VSICLIDTSVFCNILAVPGRDQHRAELMAKHKDYISRHFTFLLPVATIIETGNHVAHCEDGRVRRQTAEKFVQWVMAAIDGEAPWTPTPLFEMDALKARLAGFPDFAMRELGLGDLSIMKEWERQCELHPYRRVFIWSLDGHLGSYERHGAALFE